MDLIRTTLYGIDFKDEDKNVIKEYTCTGKSEQAALVTLWENGSECTIFPETAVFISHWTRVETRKPIKGIDYGPGSAKRRVGGGRVPRGMTEYR